MLRYHPVELRCFSHELGRYRSYGVRAEQSCSDGWVTVAITSDVTCDKGLITRLVEKCTRLQLDPLHLMDVILDATT